MLFIRRITNSLARNLSSNYKPNNKVKVRGEALKSVLASSCDVIDWTNVRSELIESERFVKPSNLDGIVVDFCLRENRLDIAKSYVNYLETNFFEVNDVCLGKLLRVYYQTHKEQLESLTEADESKIIKLSNLLINKYQFIDPILAEHIIHALSLTREWAKCLELIELIKITAAPNLSTLVCVISKAMDENRIDVVWKLFNELFEKPIFSAQVFQLLLKFFDKFQGNLVETEKMLNTIHEVSLMIPDIFIEDFRRVLGDNRQCNIVNINRTGKCSSCSNQFPDVDLSEQEFEKLSKNFLNNVMIRKDVFVKTTPKELRRFEEFLEKALPYDVVIDGLNVAFSHGTNKGPKIYSKNVRKKNCF